MKRLWAGFRYWVFLNTRIKEYEIERMDCEIQILKKYIELLKIESEWIEVKE